ncbi:hypothetical protein AVEN_262701-1 [Araneus ventricosus]|uniref:Uncharacterized protein n=1 Tax=Araneus ventricosus TaxID=182803 RepID=A0A4Y2HEU9_ARAVE|nr:hypothetical protein AVEN_262701-1 [Araneus ventricosus]
MPGDEVSGDSFQPILFEVWHWLPRMPRQCENTLRGIVKYCANSATTTIIAVREVKPFEGFLPRDAERRYMWCIFVMNKLEDHPTFLADIIWTDNACFSRNGMFNGQNVHTWSLEHSRYAVVVRHQLRRSIIGWCGIFTDRLIGPVFYEGTLTGQRYLEFLQDLIADLLRIYRCTNSKMYRSNMTECKCV